MEFLPHWKQREEPQAGFIDPSRCDIWQLIIPALASLAGGALAGKGAKDAGKAEANAANATVNLNREIYNDQRQLNRPGYITGGNATNILANQYGITPQDYTAAYDRMSVAPSGGAPGGNGLVNGLVNRVIGGGGGAPPGYAPADTSYDWDAYYNSNPDLGGENGWGNSNIRAQFGNDRNAFLQAHWTNSGQGEGRQLNRIAAGSGSFTNGLTVDPMKAFMDSPDGRIAVSGFRGVDVPEINSSFARGGKLLSGAQSIALDERGKARLAAGYGNYTNGLRSLAGQNQIATSNVTGAGSNFAANAGDATLAAGTAKANGLLGAYKGFGQGINGALGAVQDYGKSQWGWA